MGRGQNRKNNQRNRQITTANNQNQSQAELTLIRQQQMTFSGPLPPPQVLHMYNEVVPGMAERLVTAFEAQQAHRFSIENKVVDHGISRANDGLKYGFWIALAGMFVATVAVVCKQQWAASIVGGGTLSTLVTTFIVGQSQQKKERKERREMLTKIDEK